MKKVILLAIILAIVSCNHIEQEERVLVRENGDASLVINIPKAACKKCQKIIEAGLQNENGIRQSILDLNSKNLSVVYTPEKTTPEILKATIEKLAKQIPCK
ncbi:cation transporter [Aquimarina sp. AU474]|uniref:heavy-metal-associated domain-containing protein n=1 Tax=Aquimarina sp. AU474 TaxID=2108529 RepID=UPI000D695411|nr:cation transporter [Aquimarina sp. AU474]